MLPEAKKVLVIRLGAIGDLIMITPLLKCLKQDGYYVTVNVQGYSKCVLEQNPNIDEFLIHDPKIENQDLEKHWEEISKGYDKVINLSGSIEGSLLKKATGRNRLDDITRKRLDKINYVEETLRIGGYGHKNGCDTELFFTEKEERFAKSFRKRFSKCFLIVWVLSGSSTHKSWPYTEYVASDLFNKHDDIVIVTVGDKHCQLLEWKHKKTVNRAGRSHIRKTMILTKYADLVIGPETGILWASACFDTPKILFQSHSTCENTCKYWRNHHCISSDVECQPCHQLHYSNETCELDENIGTPLCMTKLDAKKVYDKIENIYLNWMEKKDGTLRGKRKHAGIF